jgi:hypothetical protein
MYQNLFRYRIHFVFFAFYAHILFFFFHFWIHFQFILHFLSNFFSFLFPVFFFVTQTSSAKIFFLPLWGTWHTPAWFLFFIWSPKLYQRIFVGGWVRGGGEGNIKSAFDLPVRQSWTLQPDWSLAVRYSVSRIAGQSLANSSTRTRASDGLGCWLCLLDFRRPRALRSDPDWDSSSEKKENQWMILMCRGRFASRKNHATPLDVSTFIYGKKIQKGKRKKQWCRSESVSFCQIWIRNFRRGNGRGSELSPWNILS